MNRKTAPEFHLIDTLNLPIPEFVQLPNGIKCYLLDSGDQELVRIDFIFRAGSWQQDAPLIASSTNSMLMEGSRKFTSAQISERFDYYGTYISQETDRHRSSVCLYTLNKYLWQTLDLLAEVIKNPYFPQSEFETYIAKRKQRFVIEESKVETLAQKNFGYMLFGNNHPYGKITSFEDFDKVQITQLQDFYKKHYHSGNCTIIISGKLNKEHLEFTTEHFGQNDWKRSIEIPKKQYIKELFSEKRLVVEKPDSLQCALRIGSETINKSHQDYAGLRILNTILGGYFGSRLMRNIREDKGYTYGIYSSFVTLIDAGYINIVTETGTEYCKKTIEEIYKEIDILRNESIQENELQLVKNYLSGEMVRIFDGPFAQADAFRSVLEFGLDFNFYSHIFDTIKSITAQDLQELAQKYLIPENFKEAIAGNFSGNSETIEKNPQQEEILLDENQQTE